MIKSKYPIVTITGTKGKTSVARMLDFALSPIYNQVLRVDTSGAYVNNSLVISDDDSRQRWGYSTPTNCPGRFLALVNNPSNISVLESTVFSSTTGLGYKSHDIGIFTNVFEDHLGGTKSLQTVDDIAEHKSFVFSSIKKGGAAIYNSDDALVVTQLSKIKPGVKRIAITNKAPKKSKDTLCYISEHKLEIIESGEITSSVIFGDFLWLNINHSPSLYNFAFVVATLHALLSKDKFNHSLDHLKKYAYDPTGGRMVHVKIDDGPQVILDFAHETQSLIEIAKYARSLIIDQGSVIGVVRLAPSRTVERINDTAKNIISYYDKFIVYDKVDGYYRKAGIVKGFENKQEVVGQVSKLLRDYLREHGAKYVERIIREDEAITKALSVAQNNDIVVYIVNDDSNRSLEFLENAAGRKKVKIL